MKYSIASVITVNIRNFKQVLYSLGWQMMRKTLEPFAGMILPTKPGLEHSRGTPVSWTKVMIPSLKAAESAVRSRSQRRSSSVRLSIVTS